MTLLRRAPGAVTPGRRGYPGVGGGEWTYMREPVFYRNNSRDLAGLSPWSYGNGAPLEGVPLGRVLKKRAVGAVVCCDPYTWFERSHLIGNPSGFLLGLPHMGKSTLLRRWIIGMDHLGIRTIVLGDLKGEYVLLIAALGGQVISVGRGRGFINVLDMHEALVGVKRLRANGFAVEADQLLAEAKARRQAAVETLASVHRKEALSSEDSANLAAALRELDTKRLGEPILKDLLAVIQHPTEAMHEVALSRGSLETYQAHTRRLEADLVALSRDYGLGEIFSQRTTTRMKPDGHVVFDVSTISDTDESLQASALMICWAIGFGQIAVNNTLADCGLQPQQPVNVLQDEIWRALRIGPGMVKVSDGLTRLNRDKGVISTKATHSMSDLLALPTEADRRIAMGMVERSGMVICAALPFAEMPMLRGAVALNPAEQKMMNSWTTPPTWSTKKTRAKGHPGRGKFLIKVGERAGIPVKLDLVPMELQYSDTNARFAMGS